MTRPAPTFRLARFAAPLLALGCASAAMAQTPDPGDVDGTVVAGFDASLGFTTPGAVATVAVTPGDRVEAGQTLASLDERLVQAEASLAKLLADSDADVRAAEARVEALRSERGSAAAMRAAEAEVGRAKLAMQRARAELAVTSARWEAHRLKAPVDGVVDRVYVSPGEVVRVGQPVLRLVGIGERYAEAAIPSDRAEGLTAGRAVTVIPRREGAAPIPAELVHLSTTVDPASDARAARFRLLEGQADLLVGSYVGIDLDPPSSSGDEPPPATHP